MAAQPPPPIFCSFLIWSKYSIFINPGMDTSSWVFINVIFPTIQKKKKKRIDEKKKKKRKEKKRKEKKYRYIKFVRWVIESSSIVASIVASS